MKQLQAQLAAREAEPKAAPKPKTDDKVLRVPEDRTVVRKGDFVNEGYVEVYFPAGVQEITQEAFRGWTTLRKLSFAPGSRLTRIGVNAFADSGLCEFVAPASLRLVDQGAFCWCNSLRRVVLNDGLQVLGVAKRQPSGARLCGVFEGSKVEDVRLPAGLSRLEENIFSNCAALRRLALPAGLQELAPYCAGESGLEELDVPRSVALIGARAFYNCARLRALRFEPGSALQLVGRGAFGKTALEPTRALFPAQALVEQGAFAE